jgi:hypothetical protein
MFYRRCMKVPPVSAEGAGAPDHGRDLGRGALALGASQTDDPAQPGGSPVATARATADAAVVGWKAVAHALVPIIGSTSVTALYRRCLVSVGVDHTWLPSVTAADLPDNDWTVLHASMSRQTAEQAAQACASLFVSFQELLGSLIGPSLTEQLLHPVSAPPFHGSAEQDPLP